MLYICEINLIFNNPTEVDSLHLRILQEMALYQNDFENMEEEEDIFFHDDRNDVSDKNWNNTNNKTA